MKNVLTSATVALLAAVLSVVPGAHAAYNLVQTWQGQSFFDGWDFYGAYDNLTNVSPLRFCRRMTFNPDAGGRDLGEPISRHQQPPSIRGQQWKGHSQSRQHDECLVQRQT